MSNGTTVKCSGCQAQRDWLMRVGGEYRCQQCIDELYDELVELRRKCALFERLDDAGTIAESLHRSIK